MTISSTEARELAVPAAEAEPDPAAPPGPSPVSREAAEKVLDYLVFHRSLLGEHDGASPLLERYLALVQNLEEGVHIVISEPIQKATALLFELVLDESFDPWEIDLVRFTEAYLERVRQEETVNFAVAGRLLAMAWNILYMQSEAVLHHRELPPEGADFGTADAEPIDPSAETYLDLLETPEAVDVTSTILDAATESPLLEMVRHPETRPVTLLELVRAFDEAESEALHSARIQELRERLREEQRAPPEVLVHGDIPEQDVEIAWAGAMHHPVGEPFPLLELWRESAGRGRLVTIFLAVLYLAREHSIEFRQERLLETPILLVRMSEKRVPVTEREVE
ncbi:MAG: hypothetical protein ACREBZ_05780 [Thermoplasmata archaeon]